MKKLLSIIAIAAFTACGGGSNEPADGVDTTTMSSGAANMNTSDVDMRNTDTTDVGGGLRGDSTSASGIHGGGSGSRVGGGKTGEPQSGGSKKPQ